MERAGLYTYYFNNSEETMRGKSRQHVVDSIEGMNSLSTVYRLLPTEKGFTLIELLITMVVFVLAIAAASQIFTGLLTQFKQQSKIAETNIEGVVGLEILRRDIEHAGYGLPWVIPAGINTYQEAAAGYNDSPSGPPRAILSGNGAGFNNSDELIIKAANVARNGASQEWTRLQTGNIKRDGLSGETLDGADLIIVLSPGTSDATRRTLIANGVDWDTTYNTTSNFDPADNTETYFIYGIAPTTATVTTLRMPFNRADYYINVPAINMPARCATNTGVLYKATVNHSDGELTELPLLDCVADMQVVFRLDMNENGTVGTIANADGSTVTSDPIDSTAENATAATVQATFADAALLRQRLKEVRVYILAHEGQYDRTYTFSNFTCGATCITVGEFGLGMPFDLSAITNYPNYRWKLYTLVVKPNNLR